MQLAVVLRHPKTIPDQLVVEFVEKSAVVAAVIEFAVNYIQELHIALVLVDDGDLGVDDDDGLGIDGAGDVGIDDLFLEYSLLHRPELNSLDVYNILFHRVYCALLELKN